MTRLQYVADPLCSWCYGFAPTLEKIEQRFEVEIVLGGLAPDAEEPMDPAMSRYVQGAWRAVEEATGQPFDHSLWAKAAPRRSTWPACRAVIAAEEVAGRGRAMFRALQAAFYTQARDATDPAVVLEVARELGLDLEPTLDAPATKAALEEHFRRRDEFGVSGFPSLIHAGRTIMAGWEPETRVLDRLAGIPNDPPAVP